MRRGRGKREEKAGEAIQGFLWNAGAFGVIWATLDLPAVALGFWGIGLAMHGVATVPALRAWWRKRRASAQREHPEQATAAEALPAAASSQADPFLAELERALAALGPASGGRPLPQGLDLAALRREAEALRDRHLALAGLATGDARERLVAERAETVARAEAAPDPRTAEVLREQARTVADRLEALDEAAGAAARLDARERTLLHQLEALRLSLVRAGVDEERAPDLAGEVRSLQLDVKAASELEADLARARLGAARRQPT
jgi:hypothetical protein